MRDFYTTSSCSGRISIMSQPLERTKGGKWLLVTHDKINYSEAKEALINLSNFSSSTAPTASVVPMGGEDLVVFRFEPMVLSVECRTLALADRLVQRAILCGFRESGISSVKKRVMATIRTSLRLEAPVGKGGRLLVSDEYLQILCALANDKLHQNWIRMDRFHSQICQAGSCDLNTR
mmetsp:Transcript_20573/g.33401  ORF Transcript_20573/g.33401 Transcript_20573/m.33401 type:complete len:178 (+) Transcript_20573:195-728(+)